MQLDLTIIKNETLIKFEKSLKTVRNKFHEWLAIGLDTAILEIDIDRRFDVVQEVEDIINDQNDKFKIEFLRMLNKVAEIVETKLGDKDALS